MLRLYTIPYSTNVERVGLALAHKGLEVERVPVDPADRSPVRAVSGQDLVPVLVDGDTVLADSSRILHHLEARHPDPPLFPADPAARRRGGDLHRLVQPRVEARAQPDHRRARGGRRGDRGAAALGRRGCSAGSTCSRACCRGATTCSATSARRTAWRGRSCATPSATSSPTTTSCSTGSWPSAMTLTDRHDRLRAWIARVGGAPHRVALRALLGYGRAMEAHSAGRRARARAIGWLVAGGAAMVLIWVALPHPDAAHDGPVIALVVATWVLAALLLAGPLRPRLAARHDRRARRRRDPDLGDAAGHRRPRERLRPVLRLPRAVRVRGDGPALRDRVDGVHRRALRRRPDRARRRRAGRRRRRRPRGPLARRRLRVRRARACSRGTSPPCGASARTASGAASRTPRSGWRSSAPTGAGPRSTTRCAGCSAAPASS